MTDTTELAPVTTGPAYGREGLERDAGLVPYKDDTEETSDDLTKEDAADRYKELSGPESAIVTYGSGLPANVTLTVEDAGKMLAEAREADAMETDTDDTKAQQKEIDTLRGVDEAAKPQTETEDDLVERALKSKKVQAAITERVTAAETQRTHHEAAVAHATNFAVASLFGDFPELADLSPAEWDGVVQRMPQARAQSLGNKLQALARVEALNQQITAEKNARENGEFKSYAAQEDARFADMVKGERNLPAIESEIVTMVKDYGVDPSEFFKAGNESKFLRSAAAQKILVDAAKYRLLMKAPKAVATHRVPAVQQPGTAGPRTNPSHASLSALSQKLSKSGSLKDAVALRAAQKKAR